MRLCFARWSVVIALGYLGVAAVAHTQELEPRAYSPSPVGTNYFGIVYAYSSGDILLDPSLPLQNVEAKIHTVVPGFSRTFNLLGQTASFAALVPQVFGNVKGDIGETSREVDRVGLGDIRLRFAANVIGGRALTREEFRSQRPDTVAGASIVVVAPTGEYNSERLVNIGSNRWAFKPEIGVSHIIGNWFTEASAGLWVFRDNHKFFGDVPKSQDPIGTFQLHGGYTFAPGLWMAVNGTFYTGGRNTVGGVEQDDRQENSRYGCTLSVPLTDALALKASFSKGFATRVGGDFSTFSAGLQYRWFDEE